MEDTLAKKGWHLTSTGLQRCKDGLPVGNVEAVIKNALNIDLRHIGEKFLPADINKGKMDALQGPCVLQVLKVRNIAAPKINEGSTFAPRMIRLQLTDGHSTCSALEIESIPKITIDTGPGTKLLLTGSIPLQRGILLLNSGNTKNLGGKVEELYSKWQLAKSLATHSRSTRQDGGPPPWVEFGKSGVHIGVQRMCGGRRSLKKSLESQREHTELDKEFEEQRKATIQELTKNKQDKSLGVGKVNTGERTRQNRSSAPLDRNSKDGITKPQKSKPEGIYRELNYKPNIVEDKDVRKLVDMGFAKDLVTTALKVHHGNVDAALDSLISQNQSKYEDNGPRQSRQSWPGSSKPDYRRGGREDDYPRRNDIQRRDYETRRKDNDTRGRNNDTRGRDNDTRGRDNEAEYRGRDETRWKDNEAEYSRGRDETKWKDNDARRRDTDNRKNGNDYRKRDKDDFKKGGRRNRGDEEEDDGGSSRPSGPSTLFDFLATKLREPENTEKSKPIRKINSDYEQPPSVKEAGISFQHHSGSRLQGDEESNSVRDDDHKSSQRTGPRETRSKNWHNNVPPRFRKDTSNSLPSSRNDDHHYTEYERTSYNNEGRRSQRHGNYHKQSVEQSNSERQRNFDKRSKFKDQRSYDSSRKPDRPASYNGDDRTTRQRQYRGEVEDEPNRNWNVYNEGREYQGDELPSPPAIPNTILYEQSTQPIPVVQPQMVAVFQWKPGDSCLAMWNDGMFYPAIIQSIDPTGQNFFVMYQEYGEYANVQVGDLRPYMGQWTTQVMYPNSTMAQPPPPQVIDSYQGTLSGSLEVRRGGQGLIKSRYNNGPPREKRGPRPGAQVYTPPGGRS